MLGGGLAFLVTLGAAFLWLRHICRARAPAVEFVGEHVEPDYSDDRYRLFPERGAL